MSDWDAFLVHRGTLQQAGLTTVPDRLHPGANTVLNWDVPASEAVVALLLQPVSLREQATQGMAGTVVTTEKAYLNLADAPAELLEARLPAGVVRWRLVHVEREDGSLLDEGPFDIEGISDQGGQGEMLRLDLKRVQ